MDKDLQIKMLQETVKVLTDALAVATKAIKDLTEKLPVQIVQVPYVVPYIPAYIPPYNPYPYQPWVVTKQLTGAVSCNPYIGVG
jgi:hypothetical protein